MKNQAQGDWEYQSHYTLDIPEGSGGSSHLHHHHHRGINVSIQIRHELARGLPKIGSAWSRLALDQTVQDQDLSQLAILLPKNDSKFRIVDLQLLST